MYAGRIACCPLVSHVVYALRDLLRSEKHGTDRQSDGRMPDRYITLSANRGQRVITKWRMCQIARGVRVMHRLH